MIKKFTYPFLLTLVLTAGSIPRVIELLSGNYLFGFDQGLFYQAVKDIVVFRHLTLIGAEVGGIGGFFQGPGWYYLLSVPFILFKGDPYGGMLLMFLLGIVSVFLATALFKKELGVRAALLVGFFVGLSPGIISQSRFIWPPFVVPPLTIIFLYFVLKAYTKHAYAIPMAFIMLGLMAHFEIATAGTLLVSSLISFSIIKIPKLFNFKIIVLSVFGFVLTQATLILFDLRHNFISTRGLFSFLTHGAKSNTYYSFQNHLDMYKDAVLSVSYTWYLALVFFLVIAIGVNGIFKNKEIDLGYKKFVSFLLLCPTVLFIILLPLKTTLWSWWFLELPVFFCLLLGISFSRIFIDAKFKIIISFLLVVYSLFFINQTVFWYKNDLNDYGGTAKIKGKINALDYIYKDAGSKRFGLYVFSPPVYTYPYDYLLWWYGEKKYGYVPPREKKQTFYLLIEPDPEKPWSYKGWLQTVIKTGKVVKMENLQGGFIVEKRILE